MNKTRSAICTYEECGEPCWHGSAKGFCLYHAAENGHDDNSARSVWAAARLRVERDTAVFHGWHFPEDPDATGFAKMTFECEADFSGSMFDGDVDFSEAHFLGRAAFGRTVFTGRPIFHKASFGGIVEFGGVEFWDTARFSLAVFQGDALFCYSAFGDLADFSWATFKGRADFTGTSFDGAVGFTPVTRPLLCEFDLPRLRVSTHRPFVRRYPFAKEEEGETAYRVAKQCAQEEGDYRRAGEYHYAEQSAINCKARTFTGWKPWKLSFWRNYIELFFARWMFGYGEKPERSLLAAVCLILICACLFHHYGAIKLGSTDTETYSPNWSECMHFSVVTFTTLGYGDIIPKARFRVVADIEALSGAALMALFVVCLARKYTR